MANIIEKIDAAFGYLDWLLEKSLVGYWYLGYGCAAMTLLIGIYEFVFNWSWQWCLISIVIALILIVKTEVMVWLLRWRMGYNNK